MTLVIALPVGILTAVYLTEVAKDTPINRMIKSLISMLTGVPSIIFGLMGAALFIPLTMRIMDTQGGSLISGALTMAVVVLPVIIKSTEEALLVVPKSYKEASYGLGASVTQTTFKIVLPNAIPGILSATLLSVGRIIGESAALIYGIGTAIKDVVRLDEKATTLAVHIWSVMAGEVPNIELASAIAVILLITVFSLNLTIKMITHRYMKRYEGGL